MSEGPKYLVESKDDAPEVFDTLKEARDAFDASVQAQAEEAGEGWAEEAEYLPRLSVCYLLAEHGLTKRTLEELEAAGDADAADVTRDNGWDWYAEGKVTEYSDPIAALTAERDAAIAERNEARTEASHLRSRCAAYEAALGQDHADTVSDLAMLTAALGAEKAEADRLRAKLARLRGVYECAVAPITHDRNGNPVYPHSWLRFDAAEFGRETPPFRLIPAWATPIGLLTDVPRFCDVVDDPGEVTT